MFENPAAKRVKRWELSDDEHILEPKKHNSSTADEAAVPNYGFEYDFIELQSSSTGQVKPADSTKNDDEAFHFNLFRPAAKRRTSIQADSYLSNTGFDSNNQSGQVSRPALISIRSPSPAAEPESDTKVYEDPRSDSYYFTSCLPTTKLQELQESYEAAAISVSQLQSLKQRSWPGTGLPWRVVHLPAHRKQVVVHKVTLKDQASAMTSSTTINNDLERVRRARPSKRKRNLLKDRAAKRQQIIDESKTKEEHEREKKARKNREQKLKRRAKERQLKEEKRSALQDADIAQPSNDTVT